METNHPNSAPNPQVGAGLIKLGADWVSPLDVVARARPTALEI